MSSIIGFIKTFFSIIMIIIGMFLVAAIGVAVIFIGYFLLWGILGLLFLGFIGAFIYDAVTDETKN